MIQSSHRQTTSLTDCRTTTDKNEYDAVAETRREREGSLMAREADPCSTPLTPGELARLVKEIAPGLAMLEAVISTGSVTDAAALCGVSQPTFTRAMVRWEEAVGLALFDRSKRRIELTGSGRGLAEAAVVALDTLRTSLGGSPTPSNSHRLVVASLHSLGQSVVAELIAAFLNDNPAESVRLVEGASEEICSGIRAGRFDLGVMEQPPDPIGYTWYAVGRQSLSLVIPATHPRANDRSADLRDFSEHQFVAMDARFHSRINADILCREAGFIPNIVLECDDPARLRHYVGEGRGVAILPVDLSINPRVRLLPIDSPSAVREFGLVSDAQRAPSGCAKKFISTVVALGNQYPGWADLLDI